MNPGKKTSSTPPALLWGGHLLDLHDRLWAARGVQVVRPGGEPVERHGPSLYALLGPTLMTEFPLQRAVKPLHWAKPRAIRLRILDHADRPYRETVVTDRESRLVAIRREYTQRTAATGRAWLTPDADLAASWHAQQSARTALEQLRSLARERQSYPLKLPGIVTSMRDAAGVNRWLVGALANTDNADKVFERVYPYLEQVWSHESARIDPAARFLGPVLVGAGRHVPAGAIVVGPGVMMDDPSVARPSLPGIDWDQLRSGDWHLAAPRGLLTDVRRGGKRLFDIVFSVLVLLATLPLYPFIMWAIHREDGRPFFFGHPRQSIGGREFPCYKFRTMCRNAERMKSQLVAANIADGPQFFIPDDPRLLRVGRFLRRYQLDELPQFWNVLLGHMSVVGPRPSPDKENQYSPAWREARLSVRPGVTGLWQVRRTREPLTDFQEWIRYDLEYVRHYSFSRDIRIILETVGQLFHPR
jgi:lipopolysaccharide/colanic/teichoic acid biosynthesis glycosyltransferase